MLSLGSRDGRSVDGEGMSDDTVRSRMGGGLKLAALPGRLCGGPPTPLLTLEGPFGGGGVADGLSAIEPLSFLLIHLF